jgi:hypothetical protein
MMRWVHAAPRRRWHFALYTACFAGAACSDLNVLGSDEQPDDVRVMLAYQECGPLAKGDTVLADAVASGISGIFGFYTAGSFPERFRWRSSTPEVVDVRTNGLLIAHAPGTATITAESRGVSGSAEARVVGAKSRVRISPLRPIIRVGDTVTVTAAAFDSEGVPLEPAESPRFWINYTEVIYLGKETPNGTQVVADMAGTGVLSWCYGGRYGITPIQVRPR